MNPLVHAALLVQFAAAVYDVKAHYNKRIACGSAGAHVMQVVPPWDTMEERVLGTRSFAGCNECGQDLEVRGLLQSGWKCQEHWERGGTTYITRQGQNEMTPMKPTASFILDKDKIPLPTGTSPLPPQLRGMFWLSDQKESSAMMTFASNHGADCLWCSTGKLLGQYYRIRVTGDCIWSFAEAGENWNLAEDVGLVYDFKFNDGANPTFAHIKLFPSNLPFGGVLSKQTALDFQMKLLGEDEAKELNFAGSVVWQRKSYIMGKESATYHVVQVVDENGEKIEPAWSSFVKYEKSKVAGSSPGRVFLHGCEKRFSLAEQ